MFEQLLARLSLALDAAEISYMVIGGQAVLVYRDPRLTQDVDIVLGLAPDQLEAVVDLPLVDTFRQLYRETRP